MLASAAWRLPTCLCSRPARERMNTSNSGQSSDLGSSVTLPPLTRSWRSRTLLERMGRGCITHPRALIVCTAARFQALPVAGSVALEDRVEFLPIDLAVLVVPGSAVAAQLRVRNEEAEKLGLGDGGVDESLAQLIVGEALDLPSHRLLGVPGLAIAGAEHHDRGPPPAIQRVLRHRALLRAATRQRQHDLEPLSLVKALLLADAYHGACVRAVGATAQGDLIHDRRAVDQPADGAHVRPCQRRVVEDAGILRRSGEQLLQHLRPRDPQSLRSAVEIHSVTALILHLGDEHGLAP